MKIEIKVTGLEPLVHALEQIALAMPPADAPPPKPAAEAKPPAKRKAPAQKPKAKAGNGAKGVDWDAEKGKLSTLVQKAVQAGHGPAVKDLLAIEGAKRVSDIPQDVDTYARFAVAVEGLMEATS